MATVRFYFITADGDATRLCSLQPKISCGPVTSCRDSEFRPAGSLFFALSVHEINKILREENVRQLHVLSRAGEEAQSRPQQQFM